MMKKTMFILAVGLVVNTQAYASDPVAGKEKSKACAECHGENGISKAPDFPNLAGQHSSYIVRALSDYKSGARKNAIMASQVANLKPNDIADLAAFFSSRPAVLQYKY